MSHVHLDCHYNAAGLSNTIIEVNICLDPVADNLRYRTHLGTFLDRLARYEGLIGYEFEERIERKGSAVLANMGQGNYTEHHSFYDFFGNQVAQFSSMFCIQPECEVGVARSFTYREE
jgi:hypothetical protein